MLGRFLAPAVGWPAWLGLVEDGLALLVAAPAAAAVGGLLFRADVSTFSGSRGLLAAACISTSRLLHRSRGIHGCMSFTQGRRALEVPFWFSGTDQ